MDLTRRTALMALSALVADKAIAAKQVCPTAPDAPVAPTCAVWTREVLDDPAVTSWTVPPGVLGIQVEGWGAGAGGGALGGVEDIYAGGGGAYTVLGMFTVVPGQVFPVHVGRGGTAGVDGEATTFGTGPLLFADGGYANGDGGLADNCIPTIEPVVGGFSYYAAHDGGGGGTSFVSGVGTGWNPDDSTSNVSPFASPPANLASFTTTSPGATRSTSSKGSGKFFFEFGLYGSVGTQDGFGVCTGDVSLTGMVSTGTEAVLVRQNGSIYVNGTAVGSIGQTLNTTPANWVYVSVAIDTVAMKIWFQSQFPGPGFLPWNNSGTADPATGVGGIDISSVFTGKQAFSCVTSNSAYSVDTTGPLYGAWWTLDGFNSPSDMPAGFVPWDNSVATVFGAGGGGAAGWMQFGGQGDNNGDGVTVYSGGGGAAQYGGGTGVVAGVGGQSWDLTLGGTAGGGAGAHGSGGGGGPTGGAGGAGYDITTGVGMPPGGPGGGGGGGSASGAGGAGGKWGGGGGAGVPGGIGADGALMISYVADSISPCDVTVPAGGAYNLALMDSNAYIYYTTDSSGTWTQTGAYPAARGFVWQGMTTGINEGNYVKWAIQAFATQLYPISGGFNHGAVAVAPWPLTNMATTVPVRYDEPGPQGSISEWVAYSPNTGLVYVANSLSTDGSGNYYNVDLRHSTDHGLTWSGLPGLTGPPWQQLDQFGHLLNNGWHNVCFSNNAQTIYVKELDGLIHKSTDGGATWHMLPTGPFFDETPGSFETNLFCSQDGMTVVALSKFEMQLWISHDGGVNWITHYIYNWVPSISRYNYCDSVAVNLTGKIIFLEAFWVTPFPDNEPYNKFWVSKNGGLTWTEVYPPTAQVAPSPTKLEAARVAVTPNGSTLSVAYYPNAGPGLLVGVVDVSLDAGATWITHTFDLTPKVSTDADFAGQWEASVLWN